MRENQREQQRERGTDPCRICPPTCTVPAVKAGVFLLRGKEWSKGRKGAKGAKGAKGGGHRCTHICSLYLFV